jgi:hypothetical protein
MAKPSTHNSRKRIINSAKLIVQRCIFYVLKSTNKNLNKPEQKLKKQMAAWRLLPKRIKLDSCGAIVGEWLLI